MKHTTHNMLRGVLCVILLTLPSFSFEAEATVGGPTTIHTFTYNSQDESVYFIQEDQGGRGCPPELKKISLNTGEVSVVYSCDEGEDLRQQNGSHESNLINEKINAITVGFKNLSQINLNNNAIAVDVDFVKDENLSAELPELMRKHFTATVFQNDEEVAQFETTGCRNEQPFLYAGYAIPGFNKKIILLQSAIGDCFEGGYINETLHVIGGVDALDKEYYSNTIKGSTPLVVSEGTLLVFEEEEISHKEPNIHNDETTNSEEDEWYGGMISFVTLFFVIIILAIITCSMFAKRKM